MKMSEDQFQAMLRRRFPNMPERIVRGERRGAGERPRSCSCPLAPGEWSAGGFHYRTMSAKDLVDRELRERAERDHQLRQVLDAYTRNAIRQDAQVDARYQREVQLVLDQVGDAINAGSEAPWAFERCPLYRQKIEESIRRRKGEERAAGDGGRFG